MKILIMPDVIGWAWDRSAFNIIKFLPQYDFVNIPQGKFKKEMIKCFDVVYFMNYRAGEGLASQVGVEYSSHNFDFLRGDVAWKYIPKFKGIIAKSKILYDMLENKNKNIWYAPEGVREDLFYPKTKPESKRFVVGWVGQKTYGGLTINDYNHKKIDMKGYELILKPLIRRLSKYNVNIEFKINNKNYRNAVPHEEMPLFYNDVDVQICTSFREGSPCPMFEGAASGKVLISTRVGAISELIKPENGFLIDEYTTYDDIPRVIDKFEEYILFLYNNRDVCRNMGKESRRIVIDDKWTWKERAKQWIPFFEHLVR